MKHLFFLLLMLVTVSCPAHGQLIKKRVDNYILIDSDSGVGSLGDSISVYRISGKTVAHIGTVEIVRFARGMTAARIIDETASGIAVSDFVSTPKTREYLINMHSAGDNTEKQHILLRNKGYALATGGDILGEPGDLLIISRIINESRLEVGKVRIIKIVQGKAALEIIDEYDPYQISKNDIVLPFAHVQQSDDSMDVDYYFYGVFH